MSKVGEFHERVTFTDYTYDPAVGECISCGSDKLKPWTVTQAAQLVKCLDCDIRFANPMPSLECLGRLYAGGLNRWSDIGEYEESRSLEFHFYIQELMRIAGTNVRALDYGCGIGSFMNLARESGWRVEGTDISAADLEVARGRGHMVFPLSDVQSTDHIEQYDVVTMLDMIEHVTEPNKAVKAAVAALKPGGLLFVDTGDLGGIPDFFGTGKTRNPYLFNEGHLVFYTTRAMTNLLERHGLQIMKFMSEADMYQQLAEQTGEKEDISTIEWLKRMFISRPNMYAFASKFR